MNIYENFSFSLLLTKFCLIRNYACKFTEIVSLPVHIRIYIVRLEPNIIYVMKWEYRKDRTSICGRKLFVYKLVITRRLQSNLKAKNYMRYC